MKSQLISVAASHSKHLLATACKATSAEHAVIRLYDTATWQPYGPPLGGHNLTITRIAFSPDDKYILSVSRDRTWRLFVADGNGSVTRHSDRQACTDQFGTGYAAVAADKSHGRVIWDCAWACEGHVFATASRDKTARVQVVVVACHLNVNRFLSGKSLLASCRRNGRRSPVSSSTMRPLRSHSILLTRTGGEFRLHSLLGDRG
jgi:WD40 repeat protein